MTGMNLKPFLKLMVERNASDLFFSPMAPIKIKIEGRIMPVNRQVLTAEQVQQAAYGLMNQEQIDYFQQELEIDFAISEPGLGRFRVALFHQRWAAWRRARGLAVADLPRHADDCTDPLEPEETAPVFLSPREGQEFVGARVPVEVLSAAGGDDLRLLIDGRESPRRDSIHLPPGEHLLTAIDGRERLATVRIVVRPTGARR